MAAATMSTPPPPDARWRPDDGDSDEYDSDDEVNTSSAHVFFGKLRTPEKRFAHFHTPKPNRPLADVVNGAVQPTPSSSRPRPVAQDTSPNLISFDNSPLSPAPPGHAPPVSSQPAPIDLLDATIVLDEPPSVVDAAPTVVDPARVPLPDSPLDALSVETLLTPRRRQRLSPNQPAAHVEDAHPEAPDLEQAAAQPATPSRTDALPPSSPPPPEEEDEEPMVVSPPHTPQRASPPAPVVAQQPQPAEPVLNISVTLSPTSLHTPKRKHADAFPNAAAPPGEVRKKPFGAPRLRPADAPQPKAGPSVKPAPRAPMLGSLSPETDGMLSRLLVPSTSGSRQEINLNINIDFGSKTAPLPSLGTSGASLKGKDAPPSRPGSPKRVPVSVIFRSPSPPRRVLVSSPARVPSPSPPPRHLADSTSSKPTGLMATRKLPFPLQKPASHLPAPQSSPIKPGPSSLAHSQSSPAKPSSAMPASGIARPKPSQLRQPTVRTVSRIPQPKPYAPPAAKVKPPPVTNTSTAPAPLPTRAAKGFCGVGVTKVVPSPPHTQPAAPPSPVKPIMIRQVIPGMLSGNRDRAPPVPRISKPPVNAAHFGSPQRPLLNFHTNAPAKQEPIRIRQVIPGTLRHYEGRPTTPPPAPAPAPPVPQPEPVTLLPPIATLPPSSPTPPPRRARTPPSEIVLPSVPSLPEPAEAAPRRTARARTPKPIAPLPQGPQLKALTTANTLKNQAWTTTTLETLIVRRPGPRPASPSTRMRTAAEKKREEAGREREARAKRRAGEDGPGESRRRHLRGPGEESDYETPESARVVDPGPGRAVRWDPGLVSTPERRGEDDSFHMPKSCLTPAPSKARIPLHQVRREKVVVTKFVYDDDDEALLDGAGSSSSSEPEPPAAPVKPKARKRKAAETTA